jgi:hypothetical protein
MFCASISPTRPLVWRLVSLFVRLPRASQTVFILELFAGDPAQDANASTEIKPMASRCSIKAARCSIKGHHTLPGANLATDLEASRERFATCCQPHGNQEGPTFLAVSIGRKESRPS